MEKNYEDNPKSIKYYVKRWILKQQLKGKKVVDFPAGNGVTSRILKEQGATPLAFDLFPEYFKMEGLTCNRADIAEEIPLKDKTADVVISQEGIEHFSDQWGALKEFNRILKDKGTLVITTPNYSNLQSKFSYFINESERFGSMMPPNEFDSVWMAPDDTDKIYLGHIFLLGIQKLRVIAKLSGFSLQTVHPTRTRRGSLGQFLLFYPFIYGFNLLNLWKNLFQTRGPGERARGEAYREIFRLNTSFRVLTGSHLFVEFTKEKDFQEVPQTLRSAHQGFGIT